MGKAKWNRGIEISGTVNFELEWREEDDFETPEEMDAFLEEFEAGIKKEATRLLKDLQAKHDPDCSKFEAHGLFLEDFEV